jgi:hypothetical protein
MGVPSASVTRTKIVVLGALQPAFWHGSPELEELVLPEVELPELVLLDDDLELSPEFAPPPPLQAETKAVRQAAPMML